MAVDFRRHHVRVQPLPGRASSVLLILASSASDGSCDEVIFPVGSPTSESKRVCTAPLGLVGMTPVIAAKTTARAAIVRESASTAAIIRDVAAVSKPLTAHHIHRGLLIHETPAILFQVKTSDTSAQPEGAIARWRDI